MFLGIGIAAATAAGFPLTLLGAVGMILAMIVTRIALSAAVYGAGCFSSCLGGAALAAKERCC